ncbi:MAG: hypothetical protein WB952_20230 [Terriglobales bacterium]
MRDLMDEMAEAGISLRADGTIEFDRRAVATFAGRGIEFAVFHDEHNRRTTGRWLTSGERRALNEKVLRGSRLGDIKNFGDFLREVGIKVRKDRRYKARWRSWASDQLIVRIS